MRILAIRGQNLASLAGQFEVDFEKHPLGDAGIFAITGPTGAGKSTLLDAMCLALFNVVPRLGQAPARASIKSGEGEELGTSDPRAILRHGTVEGYAEIDFVGRNGQRYRSTWSVQRAYRRADKPLKKPQISFSCLETGERLGSGLRETLGEIAMIVGLTADQFRRAVMLAQGDFEAFIRANADDRAILLERLTGSHIYADLGRAAYRKAAELKAGLQAREDALGAQICLDETQRQKLEADLQAAWQAWDSARQATRDLETALRWKEQEQELRERQAACAQALEEARQADRNAEPRREILRGKQTAWTMVGEWRALETARQRASLATAAHRACAEELRQAAVLATEAVQACDMAEHAVAETRMDAERIRPELETARELDQRLAEMGRNLERLELDRKNRSEELAACRKAEALADTVRTRCDEELGSLALWLEETAALGELAGHETVLAQAFDDHARGKALLAEKVMQNSEATKNILKTEALVEACRLQEERALSDHQTAENAMATAREAVPADDVLVTLDERFQRLTAIKPVLVKTRSLAEKILNISSELSIARQKCDQTAGRLQELAVSLRGVHEALPVLRARRDEAQAAFALAKAASSEAAQHLRAGLQEGEPCPVCGAREHTLTALDSLLGDHVAQQRGRVRDIETELSDREREQSRLDTENRLLMQDKTEIGHRIAALEAGYETCRVVLEQSRTDLIGAARDAGLDVAGLETDALDGTDPEGGDEAFETQLVCAEREVEAQRRAAHAARSALDRARQAETEARQRLQVVRKAREEAGSERDRAERVVSELRHYTDRLRETLVKDERVIDGFMKDVVDWRTLEKPAAWLAEQLVVWRERSSRRVALEGERPQLIAACHARANATASVAGVLEELREQTRQIQGERTGLAQKRNALLDGRSVAAEELRLRTQQEQAAQAWDLARQRKEQCEKARAAASGRHEKAASTAYEDAADQARRQKVLDDLLASRGMTEAVVAAVAEEGQAALDAEAAVLSALERVVERAQDELASRTGDLERHMATTPAGASEELTEKMAAARVKEQESHSRQTDLAFQMRRDDDLRAQTARQRAELELEREKARVWLQLDELIGDSEGRKFRRFAQGVTLDRLLAHANARLSELKPRYTLERGQGGDMLIQVVDNEMGGEVRGVHNLSGGERFLVSLALALGLAEMSTGRGLRIESLFIDEGFGALDTASLGQALALLEHLHATGRRVGVISHVEEVKERIPVKIQVMPVSRGTSRIEVVSE